LFKKILKGIYQKIPSLYSYELANMIKLLLNVTP